MTLPIVLLPTGQGVGLFSLKHGLQYALVEQGYNVALFNPLNDSGLRPEEIENEFRNGQSKAFFELMLEKYEQKAQAADLAIITGVFIKSNANHPFSWLNEFIKLFNLTLIRALDAKVILIARQGNKNLSEIERQLALACQNIDPESMIGAIVTKLNAPVDSHGNNTFSLIDEINQSPLAKKITKSDILALPIFTEKRLELLGVTVWQEDLTCPRVADLMVNLSLNRLSGSQTGLERRVRRVSMCSRTICNVLDEIQPGTLIITAADRSDILLTVSLAVQKGIQLSGLLLTACELIDQKVLDFCLESAKLADFPILSTRNKSISTILELARIDYSGIPDSDVKRMNKLKSSIADQIDVGFIEKQTDHVTKKMSPPAFRHSLIKRASGDIRKIILPEAEDPRILQAAIYCHKRKIAQIVLLGEGAKIHQVAKRYALEIPEGLSMIAPSAIKSDYVLPLVKLRQNKGMTEIMAKDALEDRITLATMMLAEGQVDGLVAGAVHTTAKTITPAFKLIKTKPDCRLVSSVFFMCLDEQVLVYGDCAVNPDPTAEELAEIAIQSAESAKTFGIEPKVAMISYSTGTSGSGIDVEKVKTATAIVKEKVPALTIDGPLQYDAATVPSVAQQKAPESPVAGNASVLIFPDLNTGNTTYKAVQRSAGALSIGPVLQGLKKPVNDLSRGTTVDDIIYTIAITAIQSQAPVR